MASEYTYLLTQKAEADLDGIVSYLSLELANAKAASDFVGKLQGVIEETLLFPLSGSLVNNEFLPDTAVRKKVIGNYVGNLDVKDGKITLRAYEFLAV